MYFMFKSNLIFHILINMSLSEIKSRLLKSIKDELYTEDNREFIEKEIVKPMIQQILDQMYPYFMGMGLFFLFMFIFILIILMLNLRILIYA